MSYVVKTKNNWNLHKKNKIFISQGVALTKQCDDYCLLYCSFYFTKEFNKWSCFFLQIRTILQKKLFCSNTFISMFDPKYWSR